MVISRDGLILFLAAVLGLLLSLTIRAPAAADDYNCSGSLGAVTVDNLIVSQNTTCTLNGTRITGNLFVLRNATLHALNVNVTGNIHADGAALVNVYAGSFVGGNIQIADSGAADIRRVDIDGNLQFDENHSYLEADNNRIGGNLGAFDNTGGVSITNNSIRGNLQCRGNFPPPTGYGNTVSGRLENQCIGFDRDASATATPVPPTATPIATATPAPPTATPIATATLVPPTATPAATITSVPPTATSFIPTATHLPTATSTPLPPSATPGPPSATPVVRTSTPFPTATPLSATPSAPIAHADSFTFTGDQISVPAPGILANDTYSSLEPLQIIQVRPPSYGTLNLGQSGSFTYQAHSGYFGEDSFEYRIRSMGIDSNTAIVHLSIIDPGALRMEWISPVRKSGEPFYLYEGEQISLEVRPVGNAEIMLVTFMWWDAVNELFVELASVDQPQFRIAVNASLLNPEWNQVDIIATDQAGSTSEVSYIWLYKYLQAKTDNPLFLPFVWR